MKPVGCDGTRGGRGGCRHDALYHRRVQQHSHAFLANALLVRTDCCRVVATASALQGVRLPVVCRRNPTCWCNSIGQGTAPFTSTMDFSLPVKPFHNCKDQLAKSGVQPALPEECMHFERHGRCKQKRKSNLFLRASMAHGEREPALLNPPVVDAIMAVANPLPF